MYVQHMMNVSATTVTVEEQQLLHIISVYLYP
jgi:hypothetical protein